MKPHLQNAFFSFPNQMLRKLLPWAMRTTQLVTIPIWFWLQKGSTTDSILWLDQLVSFLFALSVLFKCESCSFFLMFIYFTCYKLSQTFFFNKPVHWWHHYHLDKSPSSFLTQSYLHLDPEYNFQGTGNLGPILEKSTLTSLFTGKASQLTCSRQSIGEVLKHTASQAFPQSLSGSSGGARGSARLTSGRRGRGSGEV